jgi:hypothetical protein
VAITTFDPGYVAAAKQYLTLARTGSRTAVAGSWASVFDLAGNPGAGVLAGTSTTTGVVPTDATAGCPVINAFGGGATGYLAVVDYGSSVACRIRLLDVLWKGGAYAFNANTTGNTPASFASRAPGGADFSDTQLWYEQVTAGTGVQNVAVTYTNQAGTTGRSTGTVVAPAAMIIGRMMQLPLQAGDTGLQGVTGVVGTVATVGTFNILVARPIWTGRCRMANDGDVHSLDKTGQAIIYADSALMMIVAPDSTSTGVPELELVIANG